MFGSWIGGKDGNANQQQERPRTRSQTASNLDASTSNLPVGIGRGRRSPSPSPLPVGEAHNANSTVVFQYDSTDLSQRAIQRQLPDLQHENADDSEDSNSSSTAAMASLQDAQVQAMVQAATQAALAALQATGSHKRKPDLPNFDPNNIEVWIRRVESAFVRANVTQASDKFAYLETKFSIDQDAKVNEFLYGEMSDARWRDFLSYLRNRYGKSVKSQCVAMMRGFQRDGRRPSDMLAYIKQETSKVTLDDLMKEMVLSSLPQDVQRAMADRVTAMTAEEAVTLADKFFDKDGKVLHPSSGSAINAVDNSSEGADQEEETEVNVIRGKRPAFKKQPFKKQPQRQSSSFTPAFSNAPSGNASAAASPAPPGNKGGITSQPTCRHHLKFGEKAYTCEIGCQFYPAKGRQGNGRAGGRQ